MSNENVVQSDDTSNAKSGGDEPNTEIVVDRTPEEYAQKLVSVSAENKKFRQRASTLSNENETLKKRIEELEQTKLREQGEYKKLYDDLKSKYESETTARQKDRAAFVFRTVTAQFATEAAKNGCVRPDDLIKLASADGLINELEVSDDDFSVSPESLKSVIETAQKRYPYLYARQTPTIRDGVPQNKNGSMNPADLSKMKMDDLLELARKL